MQLIPKTITQPVSRIGAAAQNALEVARFGGLETHEQPSPYEVAAEQTTGDGSNGEVAEGAPQEEPEPLPEA